MPDYYSIMGVSHNFSDEDLKAAYRRLARQYHPDVNPGNKVAEQKFKEINKAFEILSSREKRQLYDYYGEKWEEVQNSPGPSPQPSAPRNYFSENGKVENIFEDLRTRTISRENGGTGNTLDIEYPIEITLEEAFNGAVRNVSVKSEVYCATCGGTGYVRKQVCSICRGTGSVPQTNRLQVRIPAGVNTGSRVLIPARGQQAPKGKTPGDLYLIISVQNHSVFKRKEDNLYVDVFVPLTTAMLGGDIQVPTLSGNKLILKIPPETPNEQLFRLAGHGMPHLRSASRGDLMVTLKVYLPTGLTPEEKAFFLKLKQRTQNYTAG